MSTGKEVTIYDLARELNISIATVSRALKDDPVVSKKTKKKIFDLAHERGYRTNHFARSLRNQRTQTIGVIVPRLNSYFMSTVIAGMESVANRSGYNLIISQSSESVEKEKANAHTMFNNRVDGLLVSLAYDTNSLEHFEMFFKKNVPLIFFDRVAEHKDCTSILIDNRRAAYEATSHLIEQGCRNIVHITATPKRNVYVDRLQGYKQALAEHNLPFKEDNIIIGNLSQEAGVEAAEAIRKMDPLPDGVFVSNDNCAVGCMLALKQGGISIPSDIAFVGFNNDPVSKVIEPNLTTINYPGYEMGEAAARHLINHLNGTSPLHATNTIVLRSELVVRASSVRV
ncbi:MAG TPA: LacI family DNA-binding transcriptional regulator [Chitinophagaceae bacterium]|nr:LacI family DNA-binding transcriptional regulator [Chitinophagaceae bacterium]